MENIKFKKKSEPEVFHNLPIIEADFNYNPEDFKEREIKGLGGHLGLDPKNPKLRKLIIFILAIFTFAASAEAQESMDLRKGRDLNLEKDAYSESTYKAVLNTNIENKIIIDERDLGTFKGMYKNLIENWKGGYTETYEDEYGNPVAKTFEAIEQGAVAGPKEGVLGAAGNMIFGSKDEEKEFLMIMHKSGMVLSYSYKNEDGQEYSYALNQEKAGAPIKGTYSDSTAKAQIDSLVNAGIKEIGEEFSFMTYEEASEVMDSLVKNEIKKSELENLAYKKGKRHGARSASDSTYKPGGYTENYTTMEKAAYDKGVEDGMTGSLKDYKGIDKKQKELTARERRKKIRQREKQNYKDQKTTLKNRRKKSCGINKQNYKNWKRGF